MKTLFCLCLLLGATARTLAADDARQIEGNWKPTAAEIAGQPMPPAALQSIAMTLAGGKYTVTAEGHPDIGTYTLDTSTTPKGMTVTGTEGPNQGKTFPCIYALDGDTLKICYDLSGQARPTEFKTKPGTLLYCATYRRVK